MFINYFNGTKPASKLFITINSNELKKIGENFSYFDPSWGDSSIKCVYKNINGKCVTSFFNAKNKEISYPVLNQFCAYEQNTWLKKNCLASSIKDVSQCILMDTRDPKSILPKLIHSPRNKFELIHLINIDPRFIKSIDVDTLYDICSEESDFIKLLSNCIDTSIDNITQSTVNTHITLLEDLKIRNQFRREVYKLLHTKLKDLDKYSKHAQKIMMSKNTI